jgi:type VI secretion system protein ImpA
MTSPPVLDFAALLAPIPGEDPSGSAVPVETRHRLEEARREDNPDDYAPDDPMRPETFTRADWPGIVDLAQQTLTQASKDLFVAARLTEALVRLHGFAGLRDGLHLLHDLVDQCWDRLRPTIEDGDVEVRASPFFWLDDPADRGARLPATIRQLPLVARKEGNQEFAYGRVHWDSQSKDPRNRVPREDFEAAILTTPLERCETLLADIAQSRDELGKLIQGLGVRLGPAAPGLNGLLQAVEECRGLMQQIVQRKRPVSSPEADKTLDGQTAPGAEAPAAAAPASRAAAYRQLAQAAALLRELEPHSPIPYLVERAVELGALPFPQLIKALIRDANVLGELNRELGIKEPSRES